MTLKTQSDRFNPFDPCNQFEPISFTPIAFIRSCYPDRFGIPRQAGLVPSAYAEIVFAATATTQLSLRGIETFSHLWVIFLFHGQSYAKFKPLVQPPRLGGRKTMGVFATRSPNRINPIGLSAVRLEGQRQSGQEILLDVSGGDFLDGTPVLDIKPYVGYADAIETASSTWAACPESGLWGVHWSDQARQTFDQQKSCEKTRLQSLINETLAQDPRPAYERGREGAEGQEWNTQISHLTIFWTVKSRTVFITRIIESWTEGNRSSYLPDSAP